MTSILNTRYPVCTSRHKQCLGAITRPGLPVQHILGQYNICRDKHQPVYWQQHTGFLLHAVAARTRNLAANHLTPPAREGGRGLSKAPPGAFFLLFVLCFTCHHKSGNMCLVWYREAHLFIREVSHCTGCRFVGRTTVTHFLYLVRGI